MYLCARGIHFCSFYDFDIRFWNCVRFQHRNDVRFVFISCYLQEGPCLIYVIWVCLFSLYLQLFVGGSMSYLCYLGLFVQSLSPVICRRVHVLFMLFGFVCLVFISSYLQEGPCLIYVIWVCLFSLYLQLFVGGPMSYLRYLGLFVQSLSPVICRRVHVLFMLFGLVCLVFISSYLQEGPCLIYVIWVCLFILYLQLFVGGSMSYLCYLGLFVQSLSPVICRRAYVLFMLFGFVCLVFISSYLQEGTCLIYVIWVCLFSLYLQLFVGGSMSYLCYLGLFVQSLSPVICRRAYVLFMLFGFVCLVFISSYLQEGPCLIYVIWACLYSLYLQLFVAGSMSYLCYLGLFVQSLSPVICRRVHVLFMLFGFVCLVFISCYLQEGLCLIYVIWVCLFSLYLQLFVGGSMSYLCYLGLFVQSLSPVICRRVHVLFMLFGFVCLVFISCYLQEGLCLIYVIWVCLFSLYLQLFVGGYMSYLCYLGLFVQSLSPVICRRAYVLFMLFGFVCLVFISSYLQEGTCLIYVIWVCLFSLYLQLFVGGSMSYLCYLGLFVQSLSPVICRRAYVLFMLFGFVCLVFISSYLQEGTCLIYVIWVCLFSLYLQLFVGGSMSYLCYLGLFVQSLSPVICRRAYVLFMLFGFVCLVFISSYLQEGPCLIYVIWVCLFSLYLLLFVGGPMSYLCYLGLFVQSLSPVICRRVHVLFMLFGFVCLVFLSSYLQEGPCLIYVIWVCLFSLYLQLFVGGSMSYLCYLGLFVQSLSPVICRRAYVLFMLFGFVCLVFIFSYLQEGPCLIYVIWVCLFSLYLQLFVGGYMSYLCYLGLFVQSLSPVICRRVHVLFMLFGFVCLVFISSYLQEGTCLIYVIWVCLFSLYLQLFVGGSMSYLCYLGLFVQSLSPVICRRVHVLFMLFGFVCLVFISSYLQEGPCLIYVIWVCLFSLYLQLFVGGSMSYLCYLGLFVQSLSPVICRRAYVLFMLFGFVCLVFISSYLQEGTCLIYVIWVCLFSLYLQLFVGGSMSYLCYLGLFVQSLSPVICRRAYVLFMLFGFVCLVFISSYLQEGPCLIYVIWVCLFSLYLLLFVGGPMSYLCYLGLFVQSLSPVICRRVHVLFMLFGFVCLVFIFSYLQEGPCLIYVIWVCLFSLYLQLFVGGPMSYLCYLGLFVQSLSSVICRRVHVLFMLFGFVCLVFISSYLQEGTCLIYVIWVCLFSLYLQLFVGGSMSYLCYLGLFVQSLSPVICRRVHVLFMLFGFVCLVFISSYLQEGPCLIYVIWVCLFSLYLQLFVGGYMSYLCYLGLFVQSLSPVICRRVHVLFMLFGFVCLVFISSYLQEGPCLIYVIWVSLFSLYLQLFVGGSMSYLCYLGLFVQSLSPVICRRVHVLFMLFGFVCLVFISSYLQEGPCLIYVIWVCLFSLYLQLFVGGSMSYLRYLGLFVQSLSQLFVGGSLSYLRYLGLFVQSLSPVICRRVHVLFMLFGLVCLVFIFSYLQEGPCLIYVIWVSLFSLYLQLFVGGSMSYLCYLGQFVQSLSPVICRRVHVLFMLFGLVCLVFISSYLQEDPCLIYVIWVCLFSLYLQLFVGGSMSYLCYLGLFVQSLSPVICRGVHVLFMLFGFVCLVFISSYLQEGPCLIYVIWVCLFSLYLQLFVGGSMSYLCYLGLFVQSLSPVICRRVHVLFMLFGLICLVFISSYLQEGTCLIYVIWVCLFSLYLQLFVGGSMSYLCYLGLFVQSLSPVICRRVHVLFTLFGLVCLVFISSYLQEDPCLIYVIWVCLFSLYLQLFVGGSMSYLCYLGLFVQSLSPVICRRVHVLFMLFGFVCLVFISSYLQEGPCLIYVIWVCLFSLYLQLFVGGSMSYLCYLGLFVQSLSPVICRRVHVLFMLFGFVCLVFISSYLQEGPCLIYVIWVSLFSLYLQLFVGGSMSYLCYLGLFVQSLSPVICRRAHVLFTLFGFVRAFTKSGKRAVMYICVRGIDFFLFVRF